MADRFTRRTASSNSPCQTIREGQTGSGNLRSYKARDVVALHWHGFDGLSSPSPITYAGGAPLQLMRAANDHLDWALSRARKGGPVLEIGTDGTQPSQRQISDSLEVLRTEYQQALNRNELPVLPPQIKGGRIPTIDASDIATLEILRWGVEDICRIYGVSPARVGQMSGGGAGVRTQSLQDQAADFEKFAIAPVAKIVDSACTKTLLSVAEQMAGLRVVTETWSVGLGSLEDRAAMADTLVAKSPIWTPNEARARLFGLPAVEGGDDLIQPKGAPGGTMADGNAGPGNVDNGENET